MKIVRPWASEGNYFEIILPDTGYLRKHIERLREKPITIEQVIRYVEERYLKGADDGDD